MTVKLLIEAHFPDTLSARAEADIKRVVQTLKEDLYLGTVVKADLIRDRAIVAETQRTEPKEDWK